jgi:hypothetical protein
MSSKQQARHQPQHPYSTDTTIPIIRYYQQQTMLSSLILSVMAEGGTEDNIRAQAIACTIRLFFRRCRSMDRQGRTIEF